jgi:parallel beta-helix repeat protein
MRSPAGLMLLIVTIGCSGSPDMTGPTSPSAVASFGPNITPDSSPVQMSHGRGVIRVPGDYSTIQAAVNAAQPGDKIQVASGLYCEQVLITTSNLQLQTPPGANRAIITGDCPAVNRLGAGIHVMDAQGVEVTGFIVEYFEWGIRLMNTTGSRVHLNEARHNRTVPRTGVGAGSRGMGIQLQGSSFNMVSQNDLHDNGRNGINIAGANAGASSDGNMVRGNRLRDNNLENAIANAACNLMVNGYARDNTIAENEVRGRYGVGIMIGPGGGAGKLTVPSTRFAQNRIHGFGGPGIIAQGNSSIGNVIEQNDVRGNGQNWPSPRNVDLYDWSSPVGNIWVRNLGTCGPGVC